MRTICAIVPAVGVLLLAGGCTGLRQTERVSLTAGPAQESVARDSVSGDPKDRPASAGLERHGFTILGFRALRDGFGQISVVGEVKNTGSAAKAVELQASLRDADGRILAVGHFYPASSRNIASGETWPFTYSFGRQENAAQAELRIVGAFRTMAPLDAASATP